MTEANEAPGLRVTVGGEKVEIDFDRLTGMDALAFRNELGLGLGQVIDEGLYDVDTLAGMAWLVLRKRNPRLRFREVANKMTVGSILSDATADRSAELQDDEDKSEDKSEDKGEDPTRATTDGEVPSLS